MKDMHDVHNKESFNDFVSRCELMEALRGNVDLFSPAINDIKRNMSKLGSELELVKLRIDGLVAIIRVEKSGLKEFKKDVENLKVVMTDKHSDAVDNAVDCTTESTSGKRCNNAVL